MKIKNLIILNRMKEYDYYIILVNLFVFVIAPFLPSYVYDYFVETYVGAAVFLLIALYSITHGYLVAVSTFTGIGSLYAEAHARKAMKVKNGSDTGVETKLSPEVHSQFAEVKPITSDEVHPEIETPSEEITTFVPKDKVIIFEAEDSIETKEALPTISLSKDAEEVYVEKNLADTVD